MVSFPVPSSLKCVCVCARTCAHPSCGGSLPQESLPASLTGLCLYSPCHPLLGLCLNFSPQKRILLFVLSLGPSLFPSSSLSLSFYSIPLIAKALAAQLLKAMVTTTIITRERHQWSLEGRWTQQLSESPSVKYVLPHPLNNTKANGVHMCRTDTRQGASWLSKPNIYISKTTTTAKSFQTC